MGKRRVQLPERFFFSQKVYFFKKEVPLSLPPNGASGGNAASD